MGQDSATLHIPDFTFGINQDLPSLDADWQRFPGHYLLYASNGAFTLDVDDRQWLLPPQRAAWVAADIPIRIHAKAHVTSSSILFGKGSIAPLPFNCRVFSVTLLAREMIVYAMRWGIDRVPGDEAADRFFASIAGVCLELAATPEQFWLPQVRSVDLTRALDYIMDNLGSPLGIEQLSQKLHISPRTLTRRFAEETHISCGQFIGRARMLRAMELLATQEMPVIEVAYTVGFESVSAFNHNFRRFTQETPTQYRKRFAPR